MWGNTTVFCLWKWKWNHYKIFSWTWCNIDETNIYGETSLFLACKNRNEAVIKCLVELGANIDKTNIYGETPLFVTCKSGTIAIIKCLVELGADINKINEDGITPFLVLHLKNKKIRQFLIDYGAI